MRSELLGLRTAGSAWSGSHPAVCESANHGRHGGHGPSATGTAGSVWTGRNVAARCDLAGMVRRGRTVRAVHGRHGSTRVGTLRRARQVRQRIDGPRVLRQATLRWARIPRFGIPRQATHGTAWPFGARQTRPDTASTATVVSDSHGRHGLATHPMNKARQATQRSAGTPAARQAWLPKARPDQPWTGRQRSVRVVWLDPSRQVRQRVVRQSRSGLASQVKAGMVLLVQARQARPRWSRKGFKSRQALCHCQSAA
jgi:hypothetical protein